MLAKYEGLSLREQKKAEWEVMPPQFSGIPPPSKIINQRAAFPFPVPPEKNGANTRFPIFD